MDPVILSAGDLRLEFCPGLGGAVTRFTAADFPILREAAGVPGSVSDTASFPLIPFSNRIRGGRFRFGDKAYQIPVDKRDPRFTNHGYTRHLPWDVVSCSTTAATLRFRMAEPSTAWPFPFTAEQAFELTSTQLTMRARTRLKFSAACMWETDELDISVRSKAIADRFDFSSGKMLEARLINHAYSGWNGTAEIKHVDGVRIVIGATGALNHLLVFTPEGKDFFGFEPVSHRPDALNPLADPHDEGMAILSPGMWLEGSVTIALSKIT
jgi:aldose 1-epimerase